MAGTHGASPDADPSHRDPSCPSLPWLPSSLLSESAFPLTGNMLEPVPGAELSCRPPSCRDPGVCQPAHCGRELRTASEPPGARRGAGQGLQVKCVLPCATFCPLTGPFHQTASPPDPFLPSGPGAPPHPPPTPIRAYELGERTFWGWGGSGMGTARPEASQEPRMPSPSSVPAGSRRHPWEEHTVKNH